jgi:hypothetical protein
MPAVVPPAPLAAIPATVPPEPLTAALPAVTPPETPPTVLPVPLVPTVPAVAIDVPAVAPAIVPAALAVPAPPCGSFSSEEHAITSTTASAAVPRATAVRATVLRATALRAPTWANLCSLGSLPLDCLLIVLEGSQRSSTRKGFITSAESQ